MAKQHSLQALRIIEQVEQAETTGNQKHEEFQHSELPIKIYIAT